jgi:spoIIIJ-associated protein
MDLDAEITAIREDERIHIDLEGADAGRVIGKKGQTLDGLQFLVNKVVNRFPEGRRHVVLDVEGYKERRDESLASMAQRLADKASRTGKVISISPMPARERRVIHLALADTPGVTTRSDGEGTERRVRIVPQRRRSRR